MHTRILGILGLSLAMAGCGNGSDAASSGGNGNAPNDASPGGVWRGTDSATGLNVVGVIDESGDIRLIRADRTQFVSAAQVSGNSLSGDLEVFSQRGATNADGSTHGAGSISGLVSERESLQLALIFKTDKGTESQSHVTLYYDPVYERPSSLEGSAGRYVAASTGTVFTVDATGHITAREAQLGCQIDGQVSIIEPNYNVFAITYTYLACSSESAAFEGVTATGLSTVYAAGTAQQVVVAVSFTVAGEKVALVEELNRT